MLGVLFAEGAILRHSKSVGVVALILITIVISVLAFRTFKRDFGSDLCFHLENSVQKNYTPQKECNRILTYNINPVKQFYTVKLKKAFLNFLRSAGENFY